MKDDAQALVAEFDRLLDEEREILLRGELTRLDSVLERKEALIAALNRLDAADDDALRQAGQKTIRNQELLQEALAGIRSVAAKLSRIRETRRSFDTYDERGQRKSVPCDRPSSVERRA